MKKKAITTCQSCVLQILPFAKKKSLFNSAACFRNDLSGTQRISLILSWQCDVKYLNLLD